MNVIIFMEYMSGRNYLNCKSFLLCVNFILCSKSIFPCFGVVIFETKEKKICTKDKNKTQYSYIRPSRGLDMLPCRILLCTSVA